MSRVRRMAVTMVGGVVVVALSACSGGSHRPGPATSQGSQASAGWKAATSAKAGGGMDALVAAAKAEGQLNVITLLRNWADYGELMDTFSKKYGIKITDDNPTGSSAQEITAVTSLKGQDRAPDVLDLAPAYAYSGAAQGLFAPYQVATWADIPNGAKDSKGLWFNDYGGVMSIGCDAAAVQICPSSYKDLDNPAYKGKVALNGDPTLSGAASGAVVAVALGVGGSLDNVQPGIDFFANLAKDGIYKPVIATAATALAGETPIVLSWDYLNTVSAGSVNTAGHKWTVTIPSDSPALAGYYAQAINADAPHPAAARLWEEYLYSVEGQNDFLKGGARPAEMQAMTAAGTIDAKLASALPPLPGTPVLPNEQQATQIGQVLTQEWASSIGKYSN